VSVIGLDPATLAGLARAERSDRARALAIHTGDGPPASDVPAVLGTYEADEEGIHFRPRFPFVPGPRYTATFALGSVRLQRTFEVSAWEGREPPRVIAVHPSGTTLPENTLRLYVQFSRPMNARGVARHVRLVGADGRLVPLAFVEVEDGLWDPAQTRLTLFLHPGRVKRGVAPGERLGPPLRSGGHYRLVVDGALADASGVPMGRTYEHAFRALEADRASPVAGEVRVEGPASARAPVEVVLPEPLDHALLQRWVWVEDERGIPVDGEAEVAEAETRWTFTPRERWRPGRYAVRLRAAIEDRAGNRFDRLFDRASGAASAADSAAETLSLPFDVAW